MKLLIIGGTGQLGSSLIKNATLLNHDIISPSRKELDISDNNQFSKFLLEHEPDIVINTAAFLDVYLCEIEPENAFKYNSIAVHNMSKICFDKGLKFITFSTDYVFSGMLLFSGNGRIKTEIKTEPYVETDPPQPLQIYGLSKLAGEYGSLIYPTTTVIRTCGLYGNREGIGIGIGNISNECKSKGGKGNFVDNRIKDSKTKDRIEISNEETVCPTFTGDLSKAVLQLIEHYNSESDNSESDNSDISGIFHLVNEGQCSWYEFTKTIFEILDISCEVVPVNRGGYFGGVRKPLFSVLKNERAFKKYNIKLSHWKDGLNRYLY